MSENSLHGQAGANENENDWKHEAPYRIHGSNDGFKVKHEASCHCGKVQYQLSREAPLDSKFCHCIECQVQHGAPFQWAAIFHKDDINFTRGFEGLEWYDSGAKVSKHRLPSKVRCAHCKSPIMDEGRRMILLFPTLIKFNSEEARRGFRPKLHMFYSQRVVDIPDGLPKWRLAPVFANNNQRRVHTVSFVAFIDTDHFSWTDWTRNDGEAEAPRESITGQQSAPSRQSWATRTRISVMAKRKRGIPKTTSGKKRAKGALHAHGSIDPEREYQVKSIVAEDETRYLVSWEDDDETGEHFADTWEPKANCNQTAIDDWEAQKTEKKRSKAHSERQSASRSVSASSNPRRATPRKSSAPARSRGRPRRVVESSPVGASTQPDASRGEGRGQEDDLLEIGESQPTPPASPQPLDHPSPLFEPEDTDSGGSLLRPPPAAAVQPSTPSSSYLAGEYQHVAASQLPSSIGPPASRSSPEPSQYLPDQTSTSGTNGVSFASGASLPQSPSLAVDFVQSSTRIVPDSQSNSGSAKPPHTNGDPPVEPDINTAGATQSDQHDSQGPNPTPSGAGPDQPSSTDLPPPAGVSSSGRQSQSLQANGGEAPRSSQESNPSQLESAGSNHLVTSPLHSPEFTESQVLADQPPASSIHSVRNPFQHTGSRNVSLGSPSLIDATQQPHSPAHQGSAHLNSSTPSVSQSESIRGEAGLDTSSQATATKQLSSPNSPQPPYKSPVDLTNTQHQSTSTSKFTVTPPPQISREALFRRPRDYAFDSSLLFQTQLSQPTTARPPSRRFETSNTSSFPYLRDYYQRGDLLTSVDRAISLPVEQVSPLLSSSPIVAPPSQSIEGRAIGESAPPRPLVFSTPSGVTNASRPMDTQTDLLAKMRAARQRHKSSDTVRRSESVASTTPEPSSNAKVAAIVETSGRKQARSTLVSPFLFNPERGRSPSAVPAEKPLPVITLEEMTTSGRYETLLPQSQTEDSAAMQQDSSFATKDSSPRPSIPNQAPELAGVHAIPIYLVGHQRDQYTSMVNFYKDPIQRFLAASSPDEELTQEATQIVTRLQRITLHPDLDNAETYTQYDVLPPDQADWDTKCSAKFRFLRDLLIPLKAENLRIAVIAQSGRILEILKTFMEGIDVPYQPLNPEKEMETPEDSRIGGLKVVLLEADGQGTDNLRVNLVIAMDSSVRHDIAQVRSLRSNDDKWAPFVSLIVPRSVDHVGQSLSSTLSDAARLRSLIAGVYKYKDEAGRSQGPDPAESAAATLAQCISSNSDGLTWSLPILHELKDLDSQTDSDLETTRAETGVLKPMTAGEKRLRDSENEDVGDIVPHKRSRIASPAAEGSSAIEQHQGDITHISDSIERTTQSNTDDQGLVTTSPALSAVEKRLQELLIDNQGRLDEHVRVITDLQYRFEEQRTQLLEVTKERDDAIVTTRQAVSRLSEESTRMSTLRTDNSALKEALNMANGKLLDHSIPERAEFETQRLAAESSKAEKIKMEKRLEQTLKEVAYVRELYQTSSTSAQSLAARVEELEKELFATQKKATGEQVMLREMTYNDFTKNLRDENNRLKALLQDRDAGLKFRDEEITRLKEASRGRMSTRGNSLPRTLGGSKPGSRQTSPATGELRGKHGVLHPLRNG